MHEPHIAVLGEALIDLMPHGGFFKPVLGGSPFNFCLALARQNARATYLSPVSTDALGQKIYATLQSNRINVNYRSRLPTSIAIVGIDDSKQPNYHFYRSGVADTDISSSQIIDSIDKNTCFFHTGSLALCHENQADLENLLQHLKRCNVKISIDVNMRPQSQRDVDAYFKAVKRLVRYADVLKMSDEDIFILYGEQADPWQISKQHLAAGVQLIALTFGIRGASLLTNDYCVHCDGFSAATFADTVGSGDVFFATLIAQLLLPHYQWMLNSIGEAGLARMLKVACAAATLNIEHKGCNPPTSEAIRDFLTRC